ncbi:hypothetical protein DSL72_001502 [Monilinia vaccinii-corymbosi]|uniref:Uncharacterized protein n=1 Tax=Monilinia vaccinii-corymbosi TaxID=61207 RepID=A0A8A3P273_9HELO|nr:hypothetical protein DSL72_001502 [Monilinia vaccinii-corymbosi]
MPIMNKVIKINKETTHRIPRLSKSRIISSSLLVLPSHQTGTYNDWQFNNQKSKALVELAAKITEEGLVQCNQLLDVKAISLEKRMDMLWHLATGRPIDDQVLEGKNIVVRGHASRKSIDEGRNKVEDLLSPRAKKQKVQDRKKHKLVPQDPIFDSSQA